MTHYNEKISHKAIIQSQICMHFNAMHVSCRMQICLIYCLYCSTTPKSTVCGRSCFSDIKQTLSNPSHHEFLMCTVNATSSLLEAMQAMSTNNNLFGVGKWCCSSIYLVMLTFVSPCSSQIYFI